jgi:peptide/nickel transport system permease protein
MLRFVVRRAGSALLVMFALSIFVFLIFFATPGADPAARIAGKNASQETLRDVRRDYGLDKPMPVQYARFLRRLVIHQDLGESFATSQSVNERIKEAAPVTASLVFGGAILWMMIGLSVGIYSALKPRSLLDRSAMVFVLIGVSAHPIWIGLIFEYVFGVKLGWTPIANYANFFGAPADSGLPGGPWQWFYHLILPWCTFALLFAALYVRMIRANVIETLNEDYVRTARAKGAPEGQVIRSHVLRNALLPVVTMLGMDIGIALGGAIFTETVYQLPGLGQTAIIGINNQDLAIVQGVIVFATLAIIVFNLIVDLLYAWIDPRIRLT